MPTGSFGRGLFSRRQRGPTTPHVPVFVACLAHLPVTRRRFPGWCCIAEIASGGCTLLLTAHLPQPRASVPPSASSLPNLPSPPPRPRSLLHYTPPPKRLLPSQRRRSGLRDRPLARWRRPPRDSSLRRRHPRSVGLQRGGLQVKVRPLRCSPPLSLADAAASP